MVHCRRAGLAAGRLAVGVAIEIGGKSGDVGFHLALGVEGGPSVVQIRHSYWDKGLQLVARLHSRFCIIMTQHTHVLCINQPIAPHCGVL